MRTAYTYAELYTFVQSAKSFIEAAWPAARCALQRLCFIAISTFFYSMQAVSFLCEIIPQPPSRKIASNLKPLSGYIFQVIFT